MKFGLFTVQSLVFNYRFLIKMSWIVTCNIIQNALLLEWITTDVGLSKGLISGLTDMAWKSVCIFRNYRFNLCLMVNV